jgi:hypothetical protein
MKPWMNLKLKKTRAVWGAALGIVTVLACTFAAVQMCWLTPGEQDAAREALAAVDDLQTFASVSSGDADVRLMRAQDAVETARQAARTARDQHVAFALMQYLSSIERERETMRAQGIDSVQMDAPVIGNLQPARAAHLTETASSHSLSLKLHETLE